MITEEKIRLAFEPLEVKKVMMGYVVKATTGRLTVHQYFDNVFLQEILGDEKLSEFADHTKQDIHNVIKRKILNNELGVDEE